MLKALVPLREALNTRKFIRPAPVTDCDTAITGKVNTQLPAVNTPLYSYNVDIEFVSYINVGGVNVAVAAKLPVAVGAVAFGTIVVENVPVARSVPCTKFEYPDAAATLPTVQPDADVACADYDV